MKENENYTAIIDVDYTNDKIKDEWQEETKHEEMKPQGVLETRLEESIIGDNLVTEIVPSVQVNARIHTDQEVYTKQEEDIESTTEKTKDTSFETYNREKTTREVVKRRSWISRITRFCTKIILTLMLIPFISMIGGGVMGATGIGFLVSLGAIGAGIVTIGFSAFLITAYPGLFGWLGFFVAIGMFSGGGLVLCLMIVIFRQLKKIFRWICRLRNKAAEEE